MHNPVIKKLILSAISFGFFFVPYVTRAETISGYKELIPLVFKGATQPEQDILRESIESVDAEVQSQIGGARSRRVKPGNPTKMFKFDDKYAVIGFEAQIYMKNNLNKIAYMMLFEIKSPKNLVYLKKYESWTGARGIIEYSDFSKDQLCNIFSELSDFAECKNIKSDTVVAIDIDSIVKGTDAKLAKKADKKHQHSSSDITSGRIKEAYIDSAITRDTELKSALDIAIKNVIKTVSIKKPAIQKTEVKHPDPEYVKTLENKIAALEKSVNKLSSLLKGVTRNKDELTFSGVNLHIVNGSGSTDGKVNGLGNLIVGYNEPRAEGHDFKHTGSHNVIIGPQHSYSSYGGLVVGSTNTISGKFSTACGGNWNTASGDYSSVSGGHLNTAKGKYSTVQGGLSATSSEENGCGGCN